MALPLPADKPLKIAVIGGHAQEKVPSGTGSGAVLPVGGFAGVIKIGGPGTMGATGEKARETDPSSESGALLADLQQSMLDWESFRRQLEMISTPRLTQISA